VALKYDPWDGKLYAASRKAVAVIASNGTCTAVPTRYFGPDGTFDMFGGDIQSITIDSKQRIYVLQAERVQILDREWKLLGKFGAAGMGRGELSGSIAIDAGPGEHVFVLQSRWGFTDGVLCQRYQAFKFFPGPAVLGVDSDGDGIRDGLDQCPVDGGVVDSRGCPYATGGGGPGGSN
jgi:hypothetical protein